MKAIKYIIGALFLTLILVFMGDMYVWNMESFETEYISTTMYLPVNIEKDEMIYDMKYTAENYDCLIFTVVKDLESAFLSRITVYGMDGTDEILKERSYLSTGIHHSIFMGDIEFQFKKMEDIPDISRVENYYIIGSLDNARTFKSRLVDKYSGNFPKPGYIYLHTSRNILLIWIIGVLFFSLLSIFEVSLRKKEMILRFIHGESLGGIIGKMVISDILFFASYYFSAMIVLRRIFHVHTEYHCEVSLACLAFFCVVDVLIFVSLLFANYKKSLGNGKTSKALLRINYGFRVVISMITVIIMSVFISMILQTVNYWRQSDFFDLMRDYSFYSVAALDNTLDSSECAAEDLFAHYDGIGKTFLNIYLDDGMFTRSPCLLFNREALDYLSEHIPEMSVQSIDEKLVFIVPDKNQQAAVQDLAFLTQMYFGDNFDYSVLTYKGNISLIGLYKKNAVNSQYFKNPVIIFNGTDNNDYYNGMYIMQSAMVKISDEEWKEFVADYDLSEEISYKTNVYENYQHFLLNYYRTAFLGSAVLMVLLTLNIIVSTTVIRFECAVNSVEIAVKTTLGYGVFAKYKPIILTNLFTVATSGVLCIIISNFMLPGTWFYIMAGVITLGLLDFSITMISIKRNEARNIQRALKGAFI